MAGLIGPRIAGTLFDKYQNYNVAFYTAAVLAVIALLAVSMTIELPLLPSTISIFSAFWVSSSLTTWPLRDVKKRQLFCVG